MEERAETLILCFCICLSSFCRRVTGTPPSPARKRRRRTGAEEKSPAAFVCFLCFRSPWRPPSARGRREGADLLPPLFFTVHQRRMVPRATSGCGVWTNSPPRPSCCHHCSWFKALFPRSILAILGVYVFI